MSIVFSPSPRGRRRLTLNNQQTKAHTCLGLQPGVGGVPRSVIAQRVKIPPVLFTRIGAEADSGRVSLARGNLKSLRRSLARSESEPEVGYAGDDPPATWGSSMPL